MKVNRITIRSAEGGGDRVKVDPEKLKAEIERLKVEIQKAVEQRAAETDAADANQPRQLEAEA